MKNKIRATLLIVAAIIIIFVAAAVLEFSRNEDIPVYYSYDYSTNTFEFIAIPSYSINSISIRGEMIAPLDIPSRHYVKILDEGTGFVTVYYTGDDKIEHSTVFELIVSYHGPSIIHQQDESGRRIKSEILIIHNASETHENNMILYASQNLRHSRRFWLMIPKFIRFPERKGRRNAPRAAVSSGNPSASWSGTDGAAFAGPWPRSGGCAPG